ncbi:Ig-like domain-containing protein [Enterobacteriaceae bacterium C34A]
MRPTTLILMDGKNIRQEVSLTAKHSGSPKKIKAIENGKFILADKETGFGPENITVKRVGKDLHICLEGDSLDNPTVIIEDYFQQNAQLIGLAENGTYYPYISSEGENSTALAAMLEDGETSPLVLGGEEESNHYLFPLFAALGIFGAGFGTLAALAMKNHSGKNDNSDSAPSESPDSSAPAATVVTPKLGLVIDNQGSVQGAIANGTATDDNTPTFSGNGGTPGNTVIIYDNGKAIGETVVGKDGRWSFTPEKPLADGSHSITLVEKAADGTTSSPSGAFDFTVDTVAPAVPAISGIYDDAGSETGWLKSGDRTDDYQPTLQGRAEPGTKIEIFDNGKKIGEAQTNAKGEWSFTPSAELTEGTHTFTVRATDSVGNISAPSKPWDITIGVLEIQQPLDPNEDERVSGPIDEIIDNEGPVKGPIVNGGSTDDTTPTLNGKGEPGDTVIIIDGETPIGEVVVGDDGTWTFTPEEELGEGEHDISVIIKDKDGNESDPSDPWVVIVDTTAPDAPIIGSIADDVGVKQGDLINGDRTDDTQPTLKGTAEPGSVVTIYDGETKLGETLTNEDGEWQFTPAIELEEGSHSLTVTATDAVGNTSAPSAPWELVIDVTAPDKPGIDGNGSGISDVTDNEGPITGSVENGGTTDDKTPTFTGKGEPGDTVIITDGGEPIGEVIIDENGDWEFTPEEPGLADGEHEISIIIQDPVGNQSEPSDPWVVIVDATAPDAPVIGSIADDVGVKQGDLTNGETTDDTQPELKGTAEPGSVVAVYDGSTKLGETTADKDGNWTFTPETPLAEGPHSLTTTATDAAGNTSAPSAPWELVIDTTAPEKPGIDGDGPGLGDVTDDKGPITGSVENGGTTDDNTPTFSGKGEPGDTVILIDGDETIGEVIIDENGNWEFTPEEPGLSDGEHEISVIIQDPAGNQSEPSDPWIVIVDATAPDAPVIGSIADDVGVKQGDLTNGETTDDTQPELKGTAEPGSVVAIYDGSTKLGETIADKDGNWTFTPETPLAEGPHSLTVTATDAVGNTSAPSAPWELVIDTTAPGQPGIDGDGPGLGDVTDNKGPITGSVENGGTTDDNTPTFSGKGESGDTVIVIDGDERIGEVIVDENGNWEFTPEEPGLGDGKHEISVIIQDPAGNQSEPSDPWIVNVDTTAPDAPVISVVIDDVGTETGNLNNGDHTDDTQPTLKGTAEVGSVVAIYDGSTKLGETTADKDGNWEFTPTTPLNGGEHSLTVTATDAAGNTSAPSAPWTLDITDTTAPDAPVIGSIADDVGVKQGDLINGETTDDAQPTLKGTAEPGSVVTIYDGETKLGEAITDNDGKWEFTPEAPLAEGPHSLTTTATDAAGNTSAPSAQWELVIDTTAPEQPGIDGDGPGLGDVTDNKGPITGSVENGGTTDDNTPTFSGKGEPGDTVILIDGDERIGEVIIDENGNWEFTPEEPGLGDGEHEISIIIQDPAGNQSEPSDPWIVIVDATAPDAPLIGSIADDVGVKQGDLVNGETTDDTQPELKGTAEVGSVVAIYDGSTKLGETTADKDGNWTFTPGTPLAEGPHSLTVTATDAVGNTSAPSAPWELVIDTTAPGQPGIDGDGPGLGDVTDNKGPITGSVENGGTTDDNTPTFSGKGEPGDTVIITDGGETIGEVIIDENGEWEFTPEEPGLGDGKHEISVTIQDPAGNQSEPSDPWIVNVDTTAPDAPTIDSIYDDVGSKQGELEPGDYTDDRQPVLTGHAEAGSTVKIFDKGIEIGSVQAQTDNSWTFEVPTELIDGAHDFTAVAVDKAGNQSEPSEAFDINVSEGDIPTQVVRLSHMGKDSGHDGQDFVTDNGGFGRLMHGTLSAELNAGEELQISVDGGQTWQKAIVDGTQWAAQDLNMHTANWSIQARVFDTSTGKSGVVMEQAVTLDTTAANAPGSVRLDGTNLVVEFNPNGIAAGDRISVVTDGGAHRFEHTLTAEDVAAGSVTLDVGAATTASAALVDQAGNLSNFTTTSGLTPGVNMNVTGDVSEVYGQNRDNIFSVSDVSLLDNVKVIEGNNGIDTLKLTGADQVLDLSGWQGRLSSVEIIDITGSGDNTLKISLGDVLDQGYKNAFSAADETEIGNVQLAVKGNKGDVVVLNDLLPNGMDVGHWENLGEVTAAGIKYDLYQHSGMNADILIQQDVDVQFH